jgi:hypothetical protein
MTDISIIYDYIVVDTVGWGEPIFTPETGPWTQVESPLSDWITMTAGLAPSWTLISPLTGDWTTMGGIQSGPWTEVPI